MFQIIVGVFLFFIICFVSSAIYNTFYKNKIESIRGSFVFKWFLWTVGIALFVSCGVMMADG